MDKFSVICNQPADFVSPKGELFRIEKKDVGKAVDAPEWIKKTLTYFFLTRDSAITIPEDAAQKPKNGGQDASGDSAKQNIPAKVEGRQEQKQKPEDGEAKEPVTVSVNTDKPEKAKKGDVR